MSESTYNGHTNYQTWAVSLWLSNDEGTYQHCRELANDHSADDYPAMRLADALESWVGEMSPTADDASLYSDLLGHALGAVDWRSIADGIREDCGLTDEDSDDED
jgi:hypothetical protein